FKLSVLFIDTIISCRDKSIAYYVDFKRVSPVAINKRIHAFPTHSLADFECMWIFLKQIAYTKPNGNQSMIVFKNYAEFPLPISTHFLEKQILRCYAVSNLFEHIQSEPVKGVKIINYTLIKQNKQLFLLTFLIIHLFVTLHILQDMLINYLFLENR